MNKNEAIEIINNCLTTREILEQLAEEAAELSQAALKIIRTDKKSNNPARITRHEALENLTEEALDVIMTLSLFINTEWLMKANEKNPKWERWARSLMGESNEERNGI